MSILLRNGRALLADGTLNETDILIADGLIREIAPGQAAGPGTEIRDMGGLTLLPGIVDLHGDAFERQIMPRPKVSFPIDMALIDTDRQLIANGITTAFYGLTYSWEPGLRGRDAAFAFMAAVKRLRPIFLSDARVHLRQEVYNTEGEGDVLAWLEAGEIDLLALNDHLDMILRDCKTPEKLGRYAGRANVSTEAFGALLDQVAGRRAAVPESVRRLAALARARGVAMASHDDDTPDLQHHHADLGCRLCEFPLNRETAEAARGRDNAILLGAPNVVRGGSHTSGPSAAEMVRDGLCTVLTSDYYYPALLHAAFRLVREGICDLGAAWALVSTNPARLTGLDDRGVLAPGKRADIIAVVADETLPRIAAVFAGGRPVLDTGR
jgi:alpha-D-ribose 1-methylphosphonate 5-triphosphate diphosphatase